MIDGGVGLHRVDDGIGVRAFAGQRYRPVQRANNAGGDGAAQTQRCTRGDHFLAHPQLVGVAKLGDREVVDVVDLENGEVGLGVAADEVGRHFLAVVEHHRELELARTGCGFGDDMVVGDDVTALVDHHAGALSAGLIALGLDGDY